VNKHEVLAIIRKLPEEITPEELMTLLYMKAKLDCAEAAVAKGEVVGQAEVVRQSHCWPDQY
jgi:hypothetical protein